MSYSTTADIIKATSRNFVLQTSDDDNKKEINESVVSAIRNDNAALIDSKLRGRYLVPVTVIIGGDATLNIEITKALDLLRKIEVDLSAYDLHARRFPNDISEGMKERRKNAIELLNSIESGKTILFILPIVSANSSVIFGSNNRTKRFTDEMFRQMP